MKKNNSKIIPAMLLTATLSVGFLTGCSKTNNDTVKTDFTYDINYVLYGGTNGENNPNNYKYNDKTIVLNPASKDGYKFDGWYTDSEFKNLITVINKEDKGHFTLHAKFIPIEYSITYDLAANDAVLEKENPSSYNVETYNFTLNNPTRKGHVFVGWKDKNNKDSNPIKFLTVFKGSKGNMDLQAVWDLKEYPIDITSTHGQVKILSGDTPITSAKRGTSLNISIKEDIGYQVSDVKFNGESKGKDFRTFNMPESDLKLEIIYTPIEYKIEYEFNGADSVELPNTYTIESDDIRLPDLTKYGHIFVGWSQDGNGSIMTEPVIKKGSHGDTKFTAKFSKKRYNVNIKESNYGTVEIVGTNYPEFGNKVRIYINNITQGYEIDQILINDKPLVYTDVMEFEINEDRDYEIVVKYKLIQQQ